MAGIDGSKTLGPNQVISDDHASRDSRDVLICLNAVQPGIHNAKSFRPLRCTQRLLCICG
jgi:hypothetical protein